MAENQTIKSCEKSFEFSEKVSLFIDKNSMEKCVICMEYIKDNDNAVLKCGHLFHASCMFSGVLKENNKCPLCRTEISEKPEKKPEMTEGLMRIFIQNEFNRINLNRAVSGLFNSHRTWFENVSEGGGKIGEARYEDIAIEDRAELSEDLIHILVHFGLKLGEQVTSWISEGERRLYIPDEFTEHEAMRVPIEAYMSRYERETLQEEPPLPHDDDASDTDSDMPSLTLPDDDDARDTDSGMPSSTLPHDDDDDDDARDTDSDLSSWPTLPDDYDHGQELRRRRRCLHEDFREEFEDEEERIAGERTRSIIESIAVNIEDSNYFIERIQGNDWLYYNLADATIEEIIWPIEDFSSGIRSFPLFTQEQAEAIFGEILRYNANNIEE